MGRIMKKTIKTIIVILAFIVVALIVVSLDVSISPIILDRNMSEFPSNEYDDIASRCQNNTECLLTDTNVFVRTFRKVYEDDNHIVLVEEYPINEEWFDTLTNNSTINKS